MLNICDINRCTGCSACYNICPKKAISMIKDKFGFYIPKIDNEKCIDCKMCQRVCQVNVEPSKNKPIITYAVYNKDDKKRAESTSGGIASLLSNKMIEMNGVVAGCKIDNNLKVIHSIAKNYQELDQFKNSKYVQSYLGNIFLEIKNYLENNKKVLFIGTPCQVSGLKCYLQKDYDNLFTVDIICHGVPSINFLEDHIKEIEEKYKIKCDNFKFREGNAYKFQVFSNNKLYYSKNSNEDYYLKGFLSGVLNRKSCFSCKHTNEKRVSDITIGDFWGIGKEKEFIDNGVKDVSVALVNTNKGHEFLLKCKDELFIEERPTMEAIKGNRPLQRPGIIDKRYDKFRSEYVNGGFKKASSKCFKYEIIRYKIKTIVKRLINK